MLRGGEKGIYNGKQKNGGVKCFSTVVFVVYPARFFNSCQRIAKNGTATADET